MRILIVHNNYGKPSGEESVVDVMHRMFDASGHIVSELRMTTEGVRDSALGKIRGFLCGIYSPSGVKAMRDALRKFKPDVVNIHNLYPFISPAALFECRKAGVPVVMTVHNFRLICPTGLFMRDNKPCELCLNTGNEWSCVRYNCEQSRLKSLGYAARNAMARITGAYKKCVTKFACITQFQRDKLIQAGFPPEKIQVIPNSINNLGIEATAVPDKGYIAYCGRVSREKGVDLIIEVARRNPDIPFHLAGAIRDKEIVVHLPANVKLVGFVSGDKLKDFYRNCRFGIMASRCYEGFPMSILEAAAFGRPMIGPDHGGFTEIIGMGKDAIGALFNPGDADSLENAVLKLWNNPELNAELGIKARNKLDQEYSASIISNKWNKLLDSVII